MLSVAPRAPELVPSVSAAALAQLLANTKKWAAVTARRRFRRSQCFSFAGGASAAAATGATSSKLIVSVSCFSIRPKVGRERII